MANFAAGTDTGTILSHPDYQDALVDGVGPYLQTYNLLTRVNTGYVDGDATADNILVAFRKVLANYDITLTAQDVSTAATANKLVLRDSAGGVNVSVINAEAINISGTNSTGVIDGGTF